MGNREKLLRAARECLFEKGYERTTVRDLASTAGVSMAAIGYHFGSKERLLNQALFDALEAGDALTDEPVGEGDTAEAFSELWHRLIDSFPAYKAFWAARVETVLRAQRDPSLRTQMADSLREARSTMARLITGIDKADLPEETVRSLGSVQMALVGGVMMQHLTDPESAPTAEEILAGLRALTTYLPDQAD